MTHARTSRPAATISIFAFALAFALTVAGCGGTPATTTTTTVAPNTAKAGLPLAVSALATMAPDAKLLVVQTESPVTATSTPVWGYTFGSPTSDKTYLVLVANGKTMPASEIGTAGLSAAEWSAVPSADEWKINSDAAYQVALPAAGGKSDAAYMMGFITYVPGSAASSTAKPFVWYVSFDPASGATTGTVEVDAKTGAVLAK